MAFLTSSFFPAFWFIELINVASEWLTRVHTGARMSHFQKFHANFKIFHTLTSTSVNCQSLEENKNQIPKENARVKAVKATKMNSPWTYFVTRGWKWKKSGTVSRSPVTSPPLAGVKWKKRDSFVEILFRSVAREYYVAEYRLDQVVFGFNYVSRVQHLSIPKVRRILRVCHAW